MVTDVPSDEYNVDPSKSIMYFVNDTVHGSFKWYDLNEGLPIYFKSSASNKETDDNDTLFYKTSVAGTSCDSCDFLFKDSYMPELEIGDFLIFKNMGSYTKTCAVNFNGIPLPRTIYVSSKNWELLKSAFQDVLEQNKSTEEGVNNLRLS